MEKVCEMIRRDNINTWDSGSNFTPLTEHHASMPDNFRNENLQLLMDDDDQHLLLSRYESSAGLPGIDDDLENTSPLWQLNGDEDSIHSIDANEVACQ